MATLTQRSFSGGELSPSLRARVDLQKYQTAAATLRNFQVMRYGGACNRSGSQFIGEVKDSTKPVRLIPFVFNNEQTYILEFGDKYMRVIKNGVYVVNPVSANVTSATNASPGVFSFNGALPISVGDTLTLNGGFSSLRGRPMIVTSISGTVPGTFTAKFTDGSVVNTTGLGAFTATTASKVYELATPYAYTDLPTLQFIQSADVMTFTHHNYKPLDLKRYADSSWDFTFKTFSPGFPSSIPYLPISSPSGSTKFYYQFTTTDKTSGVESLPPSYSETGITAITKASPAKVTTYFAHGLTTGNRIKLTTPYMPTISGRVFYITVVDANNFTLDSSDTSAASTVGSPNPYVNQASLDGLDYFRLNDLMVVSGAPTTATPSVFRFPSGNGQVTKNKIGNIYRLKNDAYGFVGSLDLDIGVDFKDIGLDPDVADNPPTTRNPFADGQYPATVAYIQQRLVFANTINEPEKVWTSRTGKFNDFTTSSPSQDDQAITFTMAGRQVNAVRYLLDVGQFLILTSGGEWQVQGNDGVLTPTGINPKQASYYGAVEGLPPIIIGNSALFTQARGSLIRDLAYNFQSDGYTGNDLTVFASHLFDKFVLKDWCYQQVPHSIVWVVRDDGILLGLTYLKEQQMLAWHRHDTDGFYENVMTVPEGNEDALYCVVRRLVNGRMVRYVERFATRKVLDLRDSKYMDAHFTYDGRNTDQTKIVTLSGGTMWNSDDLLTLTASTAIFVATDIDNQVIVNNIRFTITEYVSPTVVKGYPESFVFPESRVATSQYAKAVRRLTRLWHLEGKYVSVLGDGFTVACKNRDDVDLVQVVNGSITLPQAYSVIHVGLPYVSDIETLDVDTIQSETLSDKRMIINKVTLSMEESVGGFVGTRQPSGANQTQGLMEIKERSVTDVTGSLTAGTFKKDVVIESNWETNGRIFIRQVDPQPLSVLSVSIAGSIPFKG